MTIRSTNELAVGDVVDVTTDGRTYAMTVHRIYNDPSIGYANSLTVHVHIRPGGYSVALRNDNLAKYDVRRVLACMDGPEGCEEGTVEYRESLSGTGTPMKRCNAHHRARLDLQRDLTERYPANPPSDWSPLDAGESWDEDY